MASQGTRTFERRHLPITGRLQAIGPHPKQIWGAVVMSSNRSGYSRGEVETTVHGETAEVIW